MSEENKPKKRRIRKTETVRERTQKAAQSDKPKKLSKAKSTATKPIKAASRIGGKEYYLPLPDNRLGRFLNKRRSLIPRYLRESWQELRLVSWPSRKETLKLTIAVFVFAILLGGLVTLVDYGLDKLFRNLLLT